MDRRTLLFLFALPLLFACTLKEQEVQVESVSVNPTTASLTIGKTLQLEASVSPPSATNYDITWSSSKTSVASVSSTGLVTALREGTSIITASASGKKGECTVTVSKKYIAVSEIKLNKTELTLCEGENETLTATVSPDDATDSTVHWKSSDENVAKVEAGTVTAIKEGQATVTAEAGGMSASCSVTVNRKIVAVERVSLSMTSLSLKEGDSRTLTATVSPSDATDPSVFWSSSDASVATVSSSGVVTAGVSGSATITVTTNDGGKTATCVVTVSTETNLIPEAVDLGLPSGLRWASINLGASNPEGFGDYYAWGETEPYYSLDPQLTWKKGKESGYTWESYKWCMGSGKTITKYCANPDDGYNGFTDNKYVLDPEDDAAHVHLGGDWRMPTSVELTELRTLCSWEAASRNGVAGCLVTGPNGNSIFLPETGFLNGTTAHYIHRVFFWSASFPLSGSSGSGYGLEFYSDKVYDCTSYRHCGMPVRPVYGAPVTVSVERVSLDATELHLPVGGHRDLDATVYPANSSNPKVFWSSSNEMVAAVSSSGKVTGIAHGSAIITATTDDGRKTAKCNVTVTAPDAIDLGLPSGIKWASLNMGAVRPEESGFYFAWGEDIQVPVYGNYGSNWEPYKWSVTSERELTKYCTDADYGYKGFIDNKTVLDPEDDFAHETLGGSWRMPAPEEQQELVKGCTWTWTDMDGINGYTVTGPNGKSIFLPAAGCKPKWSLVDSGSAGYYWSTSLKADDPRFAYGIHLDPGKVSLEGLTRCYGISIRPVSTE